MLTDDSCLISPSHGLAAEASFELKFSRGKALSALISRRRRVWRGGVPVSPPHLGWVLGGSYAPPQKVFKFLLSK